MGCGDGSKWGWLREGPWHDRIDFVGFDLDRDAVSRAASRFPGWRFFPEPAYAMERHVSQADVVVSFSTLEHVYRRDEFLRSARGIMAPGAVFWLNYDNGHFLDWREWKRNWFGPLLARLGQERYFQAPVGQAEIEGLIADAGLVVEEELNFHSAVRKRFHRVFREPAASRHYMDAWLEFELAVNRCLAEDASACRDVGSNRHELSKLFRLRAREV